MKIQAYSILIIFFIVGMTNSVFSKTNNSIYMGLDYTYNMTTPQLFISEDFANKINNIIDKYTGGNLYGGSSTNFYFGIESRPEGSWLALVNVLTFGNIPGFTGRYEYNGKYYYADFQYFNMTYEIAMRAYLWVDYLFLDFGVRVGLLFNTGSGYTSNNGKTQKPVDSFLKYIDKTASISLSLAIGVKYPILTWLSIQGFIHSSIGISIFSAMDFGFSLGVSFDNLF